MDCTQRAYPRIGRPLSVDPNASDVAPYATAGSTAGPAVPG
jgi:predicted transcriptional regulator